MFDLLNYFELSQKAYVKLFYAEENTTRQPLPENAFFNCKSLKDILVAIEFNKANCFFEDIEIVIESAVIEIHEEYTCTITFNNGTNTQRMTNIMTHLGMEESSKAISVLLSNSKKILLWDNLQRRPYLFENREDFLKYITDNNISI